MDIKMEIRFPFIIRQAMQVASAVAEDVLHLARPILLSVSKPREKAEAIFRFEGGLMVRVFLHNMQGDVEPWRRGPISEDWAVWQVTIRRPVEGGWKVEEVWDATRLTELKTRRPWWHPNVVSQEEIETYC